MSSGCVYTHPFVEKHFRKECTLDIGYYIHIGVGSNVVCSTTIGNARASIRGIDNRTIPRFFVYRVEPTTNT